MVWHLLCVRDIEGHLREDETWSMFCSGRLWRSQGNWCKLSLPISTGWSIKEISTGWSIKKYWQVDFHFIHIWSSHLRGLLRRRSPVHGKRRIDYIEHPFLLNKSSHLLDPKLFLERSLQNEDEVELGRSQTEAKIEPRTTGEAAGRFLQPEQLLVTDLWKTFGDENR